ncbi:MAG: YfhO family protein [Chloroflexi bacterium]|nr:YfhO family protein [Chloroflexota bacterium]
MILLFAALVWLAAFVIALARRRASDAWRDVLAIGGIGAATAGFFWRLLAGHVWMPAGGGDLAQFLYPTYAFAAEWWRRGIAPLWNPYLFAGAPFVGDPQSGIFYPLNLLTFFIAVPLTFRDLEYLSVLHFFIAGAGMYAFLRWGQWQVEGSKFKVQSSTLEPRTLNLKLARPAALAGALAFEFSDLFITHFGNLNLIAVVSWMSLVVLFYRRAITDRRASFAAIAGVLLALAFFAGHIQSFLFIVLTLVLLAIWQSIDRRRTTDDEDKLSSFILHPSSFLLVVALIAFGLAAPALLPSIEFTQNTVRATYEYEQAAQYSLPPAQLIGLFVPGFFGRGPQNAWGPWDRVEVGYLGVLPLLLAFLALVLRRDAPTRFFGALALIGLALALGGYAILHGWLYQIVPGFGQLRAPARFIVLMDFALATLAAFGFDALLRALPRASEVAFKRIVRAAPWVFLLIALPSGALAYSNLILGQGQDAILFARIANATNALAFFILLFALSVALLIARATRFFRPRAWATLTLALIFFDLFSLGAYVDASTDDPTRVFDHPNAVAFFKSDGSFFRVDPRGTGVDNVWTPDTSILYGIFDVNGDNPLMLAEFDRYWEKMGSRSARAYDLLNAKYLIARKSAPVDRAKFKLAFEDAAFNIHENTRVLPRAFVVHAVRVVPDRASALDAVRADDFDLAQSVVLEIAVSYQPSAISGQPPALSGVEGSAVRIVGYGPNEILLDVDAPSAGVLVLSEVFYPGWRAWVSDLSPSPSPLRRGEKETKVLRANYLFRAVEISAGAQRVRLLYDPGSFKIGAGLFAVTVAVLISWFVWKAKKK